MDKEELHLAQKQDVVLNQILLALQASSVNPKNNVDMVTLVLVDGVAC